MKETTKSKKTWGPDALEWKILRGKGIDIGPSDDPLFPDIKRFDKEDGDANELTKYITNDQFDYVYASHCLEHMNDPTKTILDWWKIVKPGGYLYFTVPDEDLYEQGVFPSRFNPDHKATFTISKQKSWSPISINVIDLANSLPDGKIIRIILQDYKYNHELKTFGNRRNQNFFIKILIKIESKLTNKFNIDLKPLKKFLLNYKAIDQTRKPDTLCQIQCIVKKCSKSINI